MKGYPVVTVTMRWSPSQRRERLLAAIERRDRDFGALQLNSFDAEGSASLEPTWVSPVWILTATPRSSRHAIVRPPLTDSVWPVM
jgi:hypothetical protein